MNTKSINLFPGEVCWPEAPMMQDAPPLVRLQVGCSPTSGNTPLTTSRTLTDPPAVVQAKLEYRRLDALHEEVKAWPEGLTRTLELANIELAKAEIGMRVLGLSREGAKEAKGE